MTVDHTTMPELSRTSEQAKRSGKSGSRARSLWPTAALIGVWLVFTTACGLVVWFGRSPAEVFQSTYDWLSDLKSFFGVIYDTQNMQILFAMLAIGLLLERLIPARRQELSNGPLNVMLGALMLFFQSAVLPLPAFVSMKVADAMGGGYKLNLAFDTANSLLLATAAMLMGTFLFDFFFYWFHRWEHSSRVMWQQHMIHHSDVALNVTTTQRAHFIEFFLTMMAVGLPMSLLFDLPPADIVIFSVIPAAWAYFVHMNIAFGLGPLWWLFGTPQYHRIHHSIEPRHRDKNFALFFPILDVVFGTAYAPRRGEYPATGIEGVEVSTLAGTFTFPFVSWYRMATGAADRGVIDGVPKPVTPGEES